MLFLITSQIIFPPLQALSILLTVPIGVITQGPAVWPWSFSELAGVMVCESSDLEGGLPF